ncbi:MAG: DUF6034 family protein, partial [Christensenella sp.]
MKRILIFALATLLLMTACQATPEAEIVIQKDIDVLIDKARETPEAEIVVEKNTEQMIERALETPEPGKTATASPDMPGRSALYDMLGIPENYKATLTNERGKLTVNIDVDISVPFADTLSVARVVPANFSQETVTAIYDYLIGDMLMYEQPTEYDKIQLEQLIIECQQNIATASNDELRRFDERLLEMYKEEYATAPDRHIPMPGDSTLKTKDVKLEETNVLDGKMTYLELVSDIYGNGVEFTVRNNTQYNHAGTYSYVDEDGNTQVFMPESAAKLRYARCTARGKTPLMTDWNGYAAMDATEQSLIGGALEGTNLKITPQEARATVQELLDAIGAHDMGIDSVLLMSSIYPGLDAWQTLNYEDEEAW